MFTKEQQNILMKEISLYEWLVLTILRCFLFIVFELFEFLSAFTESNDVIFGKIGIYK